MGIIIYLYHFICIIVLSTRRRESTFIGASTATGALVSIVIVFFVIVFFVIVFVCFVVCAFVSVLLKETDKYHVCGVVHKKLGKGFSFPFPKSVFCTRLETGKDKKWNPVEKLRTGRGEVGALLPMQGNLAKKSNKINNQ